MPEEEGVSPGGPDGLGHRGQAHALEEIPHAQAQHQFTHTLPVFAVFRPPFVDIADQLRELIIGGFHRHEGDDNPAHLGPFQDGGVRSQEQGGAAFGAGPQGLGHHVDAVHAVVAVLVVDGQLAAVIAHADGGAEIGDIGLDVELGINGAAARRLDFAARHRP